MDDDEYGLLWITSWIAVQIFLMLFFVVVKQLQVHQVIFAFGILRMHPISSFSIFRMAGDIQGFYLSLNSLLARVLLGACSSIFCRDFKKVMDGQVDVIIVQLQGFFPVFGKEIQTKMFLANVTMIPF